MNNYIYSPSRNMFYPLSLQDVYEQAGEWPEDGAEVDDAVYMEFAANTPLKGKCRAAGQDGCPVWVDLPDPDLDTVIAEARQEKKRLQIAATEVIAPLERAVRLGMATEEEMVLLTEWEKYSVLLNRVDVSKPMDITWPEMPDVA
ncbi:tail fiber assembly protein [Atlantibacter hermannii]|uniref:tail fiber assembly protein n=1 Tax=Atlantibacter hermannii TaxID=565 RepID=UPI0030765D53